MEVPLYKTGMLGNTSCCKNQVPRYICIVCLFLTQMKFDVCTWFTQGTRILSGFLCIQMEDKEDKEQNTTLEKVCVSQF